MKRLNLFKITVKFENSFFFQFKFFVLIYYSNLHSPKRLTR